MQFVDDKRFNQSPSKAIVGSESTKELSPCGTQKGSISIKNLPESSALKVQKEIMRPSPTRVQNIADHKLYFTDHEILGPDPKKNDMVFVPKKV